MNREEVVNAIVNTIVQKHDDLWGVAEAILNLRYPCKACDGSKKIPTDIGHGGLAIICPTCNGTGKGGRMLAVLDEKDKILHNIEEDRDNVTISRELLWTIVSLLKGVQQHQAKLSYKTTLDSTLDKLEEITGWRKTKESE